MLISYLLSYGSNREKEIKMIHELKGDVLLSTANAIVHGIAPNDHFRAGIALELKDRWPALFKDFRHFCHTHSPKTGDVWTWSGPNIRVINLFTQEEAKHDSGHPGPASLSNLNHCLHKLKREITEQSITSLAFPKICCGHGGLKWNDVKPLLTDNLISLGIPVYLYVDFVKNLKANEPAK